MRRHGRGWCGLREKTKEERRRNKACFTLSVGEDVVEGRRRQRSRWLCMIKGERRRCERSVECGVGFVAGNGNGEGKKKSGRRCACGCWQHHRDGRHHAQRRLSSRGIGTLRCSSTWAATKLKFKVLS